MGNAGKWLAKDRGALDEDGGQESAPVVVRIVYPLAERLSDEEIKALFALRAQLRP